MPPLAPAKPGQTYVHKISRAQEHLIGRAIVRWTALEKAVEEAIWEFLTAEVDDGRIVTARLDAKFKLALLRGLAKRHLPKYKFESLSKVLGVIEELYNERNIIAHGQWVTIVPDGIPAALSLKEKLPTSANDSDILAHTMPKERMKGNIEAMRHWERYLIGYRGELRAWRNRQL